MSDYLNALMAIEVLISVMDVSDLTAALVDQQSSKQAYDRESDRYCDYECHSADVDHTEA